MAIMSHLTVHGLLHPIRQAFFRNAPALFCLRGSCNICHRGFNWDCAECWNLVPPDEYQRNLSGFTKSGIGGEMNLWAPSPRSCGHSSNTGHICQNLLPWLGRALAASTIPITDWQSSATLNIPNLAIKTVPAALYRRMLCATCNLMKKFHIWDYLENMKISTIQRLQMLSGDDEESRLQNTNSRQNMQSRCSWFAHLCKCSKKFCKNYDEIH